MITMKTITPTTGNSQPAVISAHPLRQPSCAPVIGPEGARFGAVRRRE